MRRLISIFAGLVLMTSLCSTVFAADDDTPPSLGGGGADAEAPSDVENVKAVAGDGQVILSWDVATDNVGVTGYKVYSGLSSVSEPGDKYTFDPQDVGDAVSAEIKPLENGTAYYFAVTAYDAKGNESVNYSYEVSSTPEAGLGVEDDAEAPTVVEAEASSKIEVEVEFSEKVQLPEDHPEQAFTIENEETLVLLDVLDAEVMEDEDVDEGKEGKMIKLTTTEQVKDANYILTATIDVTDLSGNPIISGTSDTAVFVGTDGEPEPDDTEGPELTSVEVIDDTHVLVNFNEAVVLGLNPDENFVVEEKDSEIDTLEVVGVVLGNNTVLDIANASVILEFVSMEAGVTYMVTVTTDVEDESGNKMNTIKDQGEFTAPGEASEGEGEGEGEAILPADAESFLAKVVKEDELLSVLLSWSLPAESTASMQKLYKSSDKGGSYNDLTSLDTDSTSHSVEDGVVEGSEYWFKLTQVDEDGNESEGVVAKVTLAETGPGVVGVVLLSLGLGHFATRRKK